MGGSEGTTWGTEEPTHLQLATATALSLLALWIITRVVKGRGRPGTRGSKGKIPSGDQGAGVHVVRENIMSNQLTEQQYQIKEFHPLALTSGVSWQEGRRKDELGGHQRDGQRGGTPKAQCS